MPDTRWKTGRRDYWVALGLFACGLMCKSMLVTIPCLMFLRGFLAAEPLGPHRCHPPASGKKSRFSRWPSPPASPPLPPSGMPSSRWRPRRCSRGSNSVASLMWTTSSNWVIPPDSVPIIRSRRRLSPWAFLLALGSLLLISIAVCRAASPLSLSAHRLVLVCHQPRARHRPAQGRRSIHCRSLHVSPLARAVHRCHLVRHGTDRFFPAPKNLAAGRGPRTGRHLRPSHRPADQYWHDTETLLRRTLAVTRNNWMSSPPARHRIAQSRTPGGSHRGIPSRHPGGRV